MRTCFVKSVFVASLGLCGCAAFRPSTGSSCAEAHALADQARQAEDEGQFERADDLLERALLVNPDDAEIHRRRARLLLNHGDVDGAVAHLRYAIARDPEDAAGLMDLAELLARRGRLPEAERAAHEALSLEPLHVEGLLLVARLATARGGEAEALEIWHRVLGLEPENVEARLGIAEVRLRGEHPEQAAPLLRAVCRTSLAEPDERAQAFWALGRLDASRGRWGETAEAFTAAAALQPGLTADQWYELSFARLKNGEADEARRGLATALALDAQHAGAAALARELGGVAFSREPVSVVGHAAREEPRIGHAASELAPPRIAERSAWTTPAR